MPMKLPALGQPDLPAAALQQGEDADEGEQVGCQHNAADVRVVGAAVIPILAEPQLGNVECLFQRFCRRPSRRKGCDSDRPHASPVSGTMP